jgi:hypothetical protein
VAAVPAVFFCRGAEGVLAVGALSDCVVHARTTVPLVVLLVSFDVTGRATAPAPRGPSALVSTSTLLAEPLCTS